MAHKMTTWERVARNAGADFYSFDGMHSWRYAGRDGKCYATRADAARAFLRWKRTGLETLANLGEPIVEIRA